MDAVIKQVLAGDTGQYRHVVKRFQGSLLAYLLARGLQQADAEDIAQEALTQAYRCLHQYRPEFAFSTWLFTIARRLVHKTQHARPQEVSLEHHHVTDISNEQTDKSFLWEHLRQALPRDDFDLLWFYYVEDMPLQALGDLLGQSVPALKMKLHRLRKTIRLHLTSEGNPSDAEAIPHEP